MAVVTEGIKICDKLGLCFGDYTVKRKLKVDDFEYMGDIYRVKTHDELTRLEKNGKLLFESVPGATVHDFKSDSRKISFYAEGNSDTQMTLELEPNTEYKIFIDEFDTGKMKTNMSGKITFSAELNAKDQDIRVEKI